MHHNRIPVKSSIYIGIDGGASKTDGVAIRGDGRLLAHLREEAPCHLIGPPPPAYLKLLATIVRRRLPNAQVSGPRLRPAFGAALMAAWVDKQDAVAIFNALCQTTAEVGKTT